MIVKKFILATAGLDYVFSPELAFVQVERVTIEGAPHAVSLIAADDLIAKYVSAEARVYFKNTFLGGERVSVIYKTNNALT